jgi:hypothetical protein
MFLQCLKEKSELGMIAFSGTFKFEEFDFHQVS